MLVLVHDEKDIAPVKRQIFEEGKEKGKHLFLIGHRLVILVLLHHSITIIEEFGPDGLLKRVKRTKKAVELLFGYFVFLAKFEYRAWHLFMLQYGLHEQAYNFILGDFGF
jgi:hypothetical protein